MNKVTMRVIPTLVLISLILASLGRVGITPVMAHAAPLLAQLILPVTLPTPGASQGSSSTSAFSCASVTEITPVECAALVAINNSVGGITGWLQNNVPCTEWPGVGCNFNNAHVVHLSLSGSKLTGSLPSALGDLTYLQTLSVTGTNLTGSLPSALGNLTQLTGITITGNPLLSGTIPSGLGGLTLLTGLDLSGNHLNGSIPSQLGNLTNLFQLYLQNNQLTGSIPAQLGNLSNLVVLALEGNQLTGSIPAELGDLANLNWGLRLGNNQLSGSIPPELGDLTKLTDLELGTNQLTGGVPAELGNMTALADLYVDHNPLSGSLPLSLENLKLYYFYFNNTSLCEPGFPEFQTWLGNVLHLGRTGTICGNAPGPKIFLPLIRR